MTFTNDDLWAPRLDLWRDVCALGLSGAQILVAQQFDATRAILLGPRSSAGDDPERTTSSAAATEDFLRLNAAIVVQSVRLVEAGTARAQAMLAEAEATLIKSLAPGQADPTDPRLPQEQPARDPKRGGLPAQRLAA